MSFPTTDAIIADLLRRLAEHIIASNYDTQSDLQHRLSNLACLLFPEWAKSPKPKRSPLDTKPTQRQQVAIALATLAEAERAYTASIGADGRSKTDAWERYFATLNRINELALEMYRDTEALKRAAAIKRARGKK